MSLILFAYPTEKRNGEGGEATKVESEEGNSMRGRRYNGSEFLGGLSKKRKDCRRRLLSQKAGVDRFQGKSKVSSGRVTRKRGDFPLTLRTWKRCCGGRKLQ